MTEIWNLSALCRCCHSDGNFKSLQIQYAVENHIEIYSCMLNETLGIQISPPPIEASYTICDPCILKLREATKFKNLVLSCERKFKEYCNNEMSLKFNTDNIKVEIDNDPDDDDNDIGADYSHENVCVEDKSKLCLVTCKRDLSVDVVPVTPDDTIYKDSKVEISLEPTVQSTIFKEPKKPNLSTKKTVVTSSKKPNLVIKKDVAKKASVKKTDLKDAPEKIKSKPRIRLKNSKVERENKSEQPKKDLIKCELCVKEFKCEKKLKLHNLVHTRPFKCEYCPETVKTKTKFLNHLKTHKDDRDYKCKHCDESYNNAFDVYEHERRHTEPTYTCDLCKKVFGRKSCLKRHILWHYGKNKKVLCDLCGHSFNDKTNLLNHIRSVHEKLRPFTCEICARSFTTKRILEAHYRRVHEESEMYKCRICEKTYASERSLEIHALKHESKFKCRLCAAIYGDRSVYLSHLVTHKTNQNKLKSLDGKSTSVKCEICSNYFSSKYCLRRHMVVHTKLKEFSCNLCNSYFTQKKNLFRHMTRAHNPKPKKKFEKCTICNRNSSDLKKHMRNHTDRPYNCEFCPKVYGSARNRHVKEVHSGTLHECNMCGKTYNILKSLRLHKLKVHKVSWKTEVEQTYKDNVE